MNKITDDTSTLNEDPALVSITWLIDVTRNGFWVRMPTLQWRIIEKAIQQKGSLREVFSESQRRLSKLESNNPTESLAESLEQTLVNCVNCGLLEIVNLSCASNPINPT